MPEGQVSTSVYVLLISSFQGEPESGRYPTKYFMCLVFTVVIC